MAHERPPRRASAQDAAEAVFKPVVKARRAGAEKQAIIPGAREMVSLRIDQDVLAHFQEKGPGWQERVNRALRARGRTGQRRHRVNGPTMAPPSISAKRAMSRWRPSTASGFAATEDVAMQSRPDLFAA